MRLTASELDVLEVVGDLKQANKTTISRKLGISPDYADFLCRSIRGSYMREIGTGLFELNSRGEEAVAARKKRKGVRRGINKDDVLKLVAKRKYANLMTISDQLKGPMDVAHALCKSLDEEGYLETAGLGLYRLAAKG